MSKNFASIYSGGNDASALNQSFFVKKETSRGTFIAPVGADFLYTLSGGGVNYSQGYIDSPHRSGRHMNNIVREKTATEWKFNTYINIKTSVVYGSSIDNPVKALWEAVLGKSSDSGTYLQYDSSNDPASTLTILENLDVMAKQTVGAFVEQAEISLPGDGQAQIAWSGSAKTVFHAGIGKSITDNDTTNIVTLDDVEEAKRFDVGAMVMLIEADGVTRSADTPTGTPRKITAINETTGEITLDGAVLADADGSGVGAPIYLCYYEPTGSTGIDEPQTGLVGSVSVDTLPGLGCMRSATLTLVNNFEKVDYCYGTDGLSGALFVPGGRLAATLKMDLNLNAPLTEFMKRIRRFEPHNITLICGDAASRHFKLLLPKVIFNCPAVEVPESGSIPVSFEGKCLQTVLDAADEVRVRYA